MARTMVWLSYDLGVRGDYSGLYTWLDAHAAEECGDSVAVFRFDHDGDLQEALSDDLKKNIDLDKRNRFYAVFRDGETGRLKGTFLFGNRLASPWKGYATAAATVDEDVAE